MKKGIFISVCLSVVLFADNVGKLPHYADNSNKSMIKKLDKLEKLKKSTFDKVFEKIAKRPEYKELSDEDKENLRMQLESTISNFDKEGVYDVLDGYDFEETFSAEIKKLIPKKTYISGVPNITATYLSDLSNLTPKDISEAIENYIKTGKIEPKYNRFKTEKIINIIKKINQYKEQLDKYKKLGDKYKRQGDKYKKQGDKYKKQGDKYKKLGDKYKKQGDEENKIIKEIEKLNERFKKAIEEMKGKLNKSGVDLSQKKH